MGTDEKKVEETNIKKEKNGIKLPWWIGYPILVAIILGGSYVIYKAFNPVQPTIPTSSKVSNDVFSINCSVKEIAIGEKIEIDIKEYNESVMLISTNPEIISVEGTTILGIKEGDATVYAMRGEEKSNEIIIKCIIRIEEIKLNKTELEILVNEEKQLEAKVIPEEAKNQELLWKSSNNNIAQVENGKVKGISKGTTIIYVTDKDETIKAKCNVEVKEVEVTSISLDDSNVKLGVGQKYILKETIKPSNATSKDITWTSSNPSVIKVNNGRIEALSTGNAIVTASTKNGKKVTCNFTVVNNIAKNTIKYASESFNVRVGPGLDYKLIATVSRNDELEILKQTSEYTKLRLSDGTVGYTISKAFSSTKPYYIENVPYINQFSLGYPTGCEAVSATMAAKYSGYNVSSATIIANTPTDTKGKRQETKTIYKEIEKQVEKPIFDEVTGEPLIDEITGQPKVEIVTEIEKIEEQNTVWVGANPFKYFVGHPSKGLSTGSYGCFAAPIATALNASGVSCSNISGCTVDTLYEYIRNGKPVVIWCKKNAGDLRNRSYMGISRWKRKLYRISWRALRSINRI